MSLREILQAHEIRREGRESMQRKLLYRVLGRALNSGRLFLFDRPVKNIAADAGFAIK
jgi:hypothetical protein